MLRRIRWLPALVALLAWTPAAALAAAPIKDRDYGGVIASKDPAYSYTWLGYVEISGAFCRHGRFSGAITNRTSSAICQTTVAFTPQAAPKPKRPVRSERSCSDTRENQSETAAFCFRELHQTVRQGGPAGTPPLVDNLEPPRERTFGTIQIGAATCHSPHGWRVISPVNVRAYSEKRPGRPGGTPRVPLGEGLELAVARVRNGELQVREYDPALGQVVEESQPEPDFITRYSRVIDSVTLSRGRR